MAFSKLDKNGDGQVTVDDLKLAYNVRSHPDYQNGNKTEDELLKIFLARFEQNGTVDGIVSFTFTFKLIF